MDDLPLSHRIRRFYNKLKVLGVKRAWLSVRSLFKPKSSLPFPLASADPDLILAPDLNSIRDFTNKKRNMLDKRQAKQLDVETHFPLVFEQQDGIRMRYRFFPALDQPKGLVVIFHGYLGFEIHNILYSWRDFDLLLPLDNFGKHHLGSWFWGERGDNFVERCTIALIENVQREHGSKHWFCTGASMGGFAALYYAIKYQADGVYVMNPIIDLKQRAQKAQERNAEAAFTGLLGDDASTLDLLPDIQAEAERAADLPPLFLVQNQYDRSNPFGKKTLPLLNTYAEKRAWSGLRVHPSISHMGHDGSFEEAQYFFNLICAKSPPRRVDFYAND